MLSADGPRLIEFNARFGDPEAMNVLPLMKTPMINVCKAKFEGYAESKLQTIDNKTEPVENTDKVEFKNLASVCKYIVPKGYPETEHGQEPIEVDEESIKNLGADVFYASVSEDNDQIILSSSKYIYFP